MSQRPWPTTGLGWIAALVAGLLVILALLGVNVPPHAIWWVAGLLVLAVLL